MESLVQSIGSANAGIDSTLRALDDDVALLRGQWTGAAREAYDRAHAEWTTALSAMNGVLDDVRKATGEITARHRAAENGVKGIWG